MNGGINPSGRWNASNVNGNTVTISEGGNSSGYINYMTEPFWCGAHCYYLYDGPTNSKYLYYALKSQQDRMFNIRSGACMPNIKKSDLGNFEFEFDYDEEVQNRVVSILSTVETIITQRKKELESFDELIKARFVEMFGDPVVNQFGWAQTSLKDVAQGKLSYGSGASAIDFDGSVRYVRITDINETGELDSDSKSPDKYDDKYLLHDGDILFARSGATVGKTFRYNQEKHGKCIYAGYLIRLVPDISKVLPDYVYWYTKTSYYSSFVEKVQRAVAQPNINAQEYGSLTICVPPLDVQERFVGFIKQVDKSKVVIQKSLDETQLLFDSLMQKYFG